MNLFSQKQIVCRAIWCISPSTTVDENMTKWLKQSTIALWTNRCMPCWTWLIYAQCPMGRSMLEPMANDGWHYFHVFVCPPCPPPTNKTQLQINEVFKHTKERILEHVSLGSPGSTKNTHHFCSPHPGTRFVVFVSATAHSWISSSCLWAAYSLAGSALAHPFGELKRLHMCFVESC